jgi:Mrp family chromosome partitioning ATPase/DUF971 family protein
MITEDQILDSMRHIIDPDLGQDIVSLGFIKNLVIDGGKVGFTVELTTPACPVKEQFQNDCQAAVSALDGVDEVEVTMGAMPAKARPGGGPSTLSTVDSIIAVSSCKGGVGKSSVAAHLARQLKREGLEVGLLDTDVYGPSLPTLFNRHNPQIYSRDGKLVPFEIDGIKVMSMGYLLGESPAVLRGPIVSGYVQQILNQTDWGKLDYLLIDMPPGTGDIQLTITQTAALDGAIIVTTAQALSLVDVARGIMMFEKVHVPVLGVVENMSYYQCDECDAKHYLFGENAGKMQDRFGIPTLAEFPIVKGFSNLERAEAGEDMEAVSTLAENVHRQVGKARIQKTEMPEIEAHPEDIVVEWPDGSKSKLINRMLRGACRCAVCVDEHTGEQLLDANSIPANIHVEDIQSLGNYAVCISWSDGHSTGIFTWDYLRDLGELIEPATA